MKQELFYNQADALRRANELAKENNGSISKSSCDKIYNCEAMDAKAQELISGGVSGETAAYDVFNENWDRVAVVAYWEAE